ncbi:PPOX class F420-dependent oxidoreductase [Actinorugispora endophytica]|uniref:Pyridoxamine 5'-phosphate oxidase putative domain-containing protein n=1 Tax=Actinorugispora endophytica TaxID=1605990 RepID=A0A4R6V887_9ACTN|nr:PPOX class F420-dependent oxidoreductase [Actinorugispora endophytica]TDQ55482.1 hypothetical protein EV190_101812 [Actinorugispora endophytica]
MSAATLLKEFRHYKTALLTTYHRDGTTAVDTPVSIVLDGDSLLFRAGRESGTAARVAAHPLVDLRTCTFRGEPTGKPLRGEVRLLEGEKAVRAARMLERRHPMLRRWAMPLSDRLLRYRPLHYELRIVGDDEVESSEGWPD